jgi:hypothetical protein
MRGLRYQLNDKVAIPIAIAGVLAASNAEVQCRGNRVDDFLTAFLIGAGADPCVVADNDIRRGGLPEELDAPADPDAILFAIVVQGDDCRVEGNAIDLAARSYGAIRVLGRRDAIVDNRIESSVTALRLGPIGIWVGSAADGTDQGDAARVADNRLDGLQLALAASNVAQAEIDANTIVQLPARLGIGIWANAAREAVIARNRIRNVAAGISVTNGARNRVKDNVVDATATGVLIQADASLELAGNIVEDAADLGIAVLNAEGVLRLTHNRVAHCAWRAVNVALSIGILQTAAALDAVVESCEVLNTGVSPDASQATGVRAIGILAGIVTACEIANNRVTYAGENGLNANLEHRAVWLVGPLAYRVVTGPGVFELAQGGTLIHGNVFQGPGRTHLVELVRVVLTDNIDLRFEKVTFATNRCEHATAAGDAAATVRLFGSHMIVTGNHVKAPAGVNAFHLGSRPRVALLGNVTTGGYAALSTTVPTPHTDFNVQI